MGPEVKDRRITEKQSLTQIWLWAQKRNEKKSRGAGQWGAVLVGHLINIQEFGPVVRTTGGFCPSGKWGRKSVQTSPDPTALTTEIKHETPVWLNISAENRDTQAVYSVYSTRNIRQGIIRVRARVSVCVYARTHAYTQQRLARAADGRRSNILLLALCSFRSWLRDQSRLWSLPVTTSQIFLWGFCFLDPEGRGAVPSIVQTHSQAVSHRL